MTLSEKKTRIKPGESKKKKKSTLYTNVNPQKAVILLQRQLKVNKCLSGTHLSVEILT